MTGTAGGAEPSDRGSATPIGALYLHVPFCLKRCAYCDFASSTVGEGSRRPLVAYAQALSRLVEEAASLGLLEGLRTAYVGGGTPTILGESLPPLIDDVVIASGGELDELTFEANPDSSSRDLFDACREAGATRVSVGVQSTDDAVLAALGRIHDADRALHSLVWAVGSGLRTSADLMAGVPGQRPGDLARDVERLSDIGVGHLSVYALEVHEGTPFGRLEARGLLERPDEDRTADLLEEAEGALKAAGFERYEVSNYALPGEASRHNLAYWTGVPYLGLGTSAASMVDAATYLRLREAMPGLPRLSRDVARARLVCTSPIGEVASPRSLDELSFEVEGLSGREALAEDLMLDARLAEGMGPELLSHARTVFGPAFDAAIDRLVDWGLLEDREGRLRPTERGWLMGNVLSGELWALA